MGRSGSFTLEKVSSNLYSTGAVYLEWVKIENEKSVFQHSIVFRTKYQDESRSSKYIEFFRNGSTESFTKQDWLDFYKYYDDILSKLFPKAKISIHERRHPAVFTDYEVLLQIQAETDIEIPEKYLRVE